MSIVRMGGPGGFSPASSFYRQGSLGRDDDMAALGSHMLLGATHLSPLFHHHNPEGAPL